MLFLFNIRWILGQSSSKDLLDLSDLSIALLFIVDLFIVSFDHVNKLVNIALWDDNIAHFL